MGIAATAVPIDQIGVPRHPTLTSSSQVQVFASNTPVAVLADNGDDVVRDGNIVPWTFLQTHDGTYDRAETGDVITGTCVTVGDTQGKPLQKGFLGTDDAGFATIIPAATPGAEFDCLETATTQATSIQGQVATNDWSYPVFCNIINGTDEGVSDVGKFACTPIAPVQELKSDTAAATVGSLRVKVLGPAITPGQKAPYLYRVVPVV